MSPGMERLYQGLVWIALAIVCGLLVAYVTPPGASFHVPGN